ncbi:long-chain fatty acid--CoA ligase [Flavihumibacter sp. R14]|nr:long-chain fatty acid--CoA ligase [Flavihumibacter soli]
MAVTRIFDLLEHCRKNFQKDDIVAGKQNGSWRRYSTTEFTDLADSVSRGLIASGIRKGDKVAIMSANRPEWNICDFGIMQTGAIQVPMYPTLAEQDVRYILEDAEVRVAFVSDQALYGKLKAAADALQSDLKIYTFDNLPEAAHWQEVVETGKRNQEIDLHEFREKVTPDDLLTLIYTSGTTGTPKGVMLTHNNLVSNVISSSMLYPAGFKKAVSFLPISHIFERMVLYMYFYIGASVYYAESMDTIVADINDVKPHGFTSVPRLLEKVYDRIVAKGSELSGIKRKLFFWALELGLRYELNGRNGLLYELKLKIANKIIFNKWRDALGGNILALVSGGAALQPRLARVFWAARIPVLEGYGLTETSPVITVNGLGVGETRFGTVGRPIKDVSVKIASDGEILCKGPNVMKGYYKRPDLTDECIDEEGYFHTGDIGELIDGQYLRITDRKKEIFKTAGGKYVAPQVLENKFKESIYIEQVMVLGENERFPSALIVPSFANLKDWCSRMNISYESNNGIIQNKAVIDKICEEVEHYNKDFGQWERVKKIELLPAEWSIEGGELTPKLSLKRKFILEKNKALVEKIYRNSEHIEI